MNFDAILKTKSADDQMFIRRSLKDHECEVCHVSTLCAYDIWRDRMFCSSECYVGEVIEAPEDVPVPVPEPVAAVSPVKAKKPAKKAAKKPHGRSKKA